MDKFTPAKRSAVMRAIKGRDTLPEMIVRSWLHREGYRFRVQYKKLPGHPDIALPKYRTLIEVRGCFWHRHEGCKIATMPATNVAFWTRKFAANVARDRRHEREWAGMGWKVIVVWECALKTVEARVRTFWQLKRALTDCDEFLL